MKACVKAFTAKATGSGTQTVTGIVDENGVNFTPKAIIFLGCSTSTAVNTVGTFFGFSHGYTVTDGSPQYGESGDEQSPGFKECGAGTSGNGYALLGYTTQAAFGGVIHRKAFVSAAASGQFTLTYDLNDFTGDTVIAVCLGGTDLSTSVGQSSAGGSVINTSYTPEAVIFKGQTAFNTTTTGIGAVQPQIGWDTKTSGRGAAAVACIAQAGNYRYQRTDKAIVQLNGTTGAVLAEGTVTTWSASSFTLSTNFNTTAYLGFGGIKAAAGSILQPATAAVQTVNTGITNRIVLLISRGAVAGTSVLSDQAEFVMGAFDTSRQGSLWGGENTVGNTTLEGARYLSSNSVLRFATPAAGSTMFGSLATAVIGAGNTFAVTWTSSDGVAREVLWLALGEAAVVPPTPTGTTRVQRRLRRFALPFETNLWMFLSRLEIEMQPGRGLISGQGSNPVLMCRISRDGGVTYGPELQMGTGAMGQYTFRAYLNRLGRGRNFVVEITDTDPVFSALLDCYIDYEQGTS